jgi:hypothetical protein
MVRTIYGDDAQWQEFRRRWHKAIQGQMVAEKGAGIEEVRDRLRFLWVEDRILDGTTPDTVRRYVCLSIRVMLANNNYTDMSIV